MSNPLRNSVKRSSGRGGTSPRHSNTYEPYYSDDYRNNSSNVRPPQNPSSQTAYGHSSNTQPAPPRVSDDYRHPGYPPSSQPAPYYSSNGQPTQPRDDRLYDRHHEHSRHRSPNRSNSNRKENYNRTQRSANTSNKNKNGKGGHSFDQPFGGFVKSKSYEDQSEARKHFVAATGEFVGTFLFLFMAFLGHSMSFYQAASTGPDGTNSSQTVIFIALSYGLSLLVSAWTFYRISGGLFNPAVTLGLVITGNLPWLRGVVLFPAQLLGAICAAAVASAIIPGDIRIVETTLAPDVNYAQGVFLEMFLTSQLIFTILMLAAEKSKDTFIAPIGIGLSLFVVEIAGVYYTGASVNPARSFGPCVAGANFQVYHWIYWVGPTLGALLAGGFYHFVKWSHYEDANPGQDSAGGDFDKDVEKSNSQG